jgi:prolyl oligopeptidase
VLLLDGGIGKLLRVPYSGRGNATPQPVALPLNGNVWFDAADPRVTGLLLGLTSWTKAPADYAYDPQTNRVTDTHLQPLGPNDNPQDIVSEEVKVASYDGTMVPLSIVHRRDIKLDGSNPTLLEGYGAYGITMDPYFDPKFLAWIEKGGVFAVAHERGGGGTGMASRRQAAHQTQHLARLHRGRAVSRRSQVHNTGASRRRRRQRRWHHDRSCDNRAA